MPILELLDEGNHGPNLISIKYRVLLQLPAYQCFEVLFYVKNIWNSNTDGSDMQSHFSALLRSTQHFDMYVTIWVARWNSIKWIFDCCSWQAWLALSHRHRCHDALLPHLWWFRWRFGEATESDSRGLTKTKKVWLTSPRSIWEKGVSACLSNSKLTIYFAQSFVIHLSTKNRPTSTQLNAEANQVMAIDSSVLESPKLEPDEVFTISKFYNIVYLAELRGAEWVNFLSIAVGFCLI